MKPYSKRAKGSGLEQDINRSNTIYRQRNRAVIHKKPTPIQVVCVDYPQRSQAKITEAYYNIPSTTDYCGIYKGLYIDYEAKETQNITRFDLNLLHPHQYNHLCHVYEHGAIAFLVVRFTELHEDYLIPIQAIIEFRAHHTRKSLPKDWIQCHGLEIPYRYNHPCDYLGAVDQLMNKEKL